MKIGFIGFGSLGSAIVTNLVSKNYEIIGWNRTKEKLLPLPIGQAATPREVVEQAEVVMLNVFDSIAVDRILSETDGLMRGDLKGKTIIDTTTNHFDAVLKFHALIASKGGSYLEAPVLGSVVPARQGKLTVLVSGKHDVYDKVYPILNAIGSTIFFLGEPGLATRVKLVNNLVLGSFMATLAEAVVLGEAAGISKEKVIEILVAGAGNSGVLNAKKEKLVEEDFAPHFSIAAIKKDIAYLTELADRLERPSLMAGPLKIILENAVASGLGDLDLSAMYRAVKDLSKNNKA
jgi:3-hydroxyisobutyrate dehydrogenase